MKRRKHYNRKERELREILYGIGFPNKNDRVDIYESTRIVDAEMCIQKMCSFMGGDALSSTIGFFNHDRKYVLLSIEPGIETDDPYEMTRIISLLEV